MSDARPARPPHLAPASSSLRFSRGEARLEVTAVDDGPELHLAATLLEADSGRTLGRWELAPSRGPLRLCFRHRDGRVALLQDGLELPGAYSPAAQGPLALELALADAAGVRPGLPAFLPVLLDENAQDGLETRRAAALDLAGRGIPLAQAPAWARGRRVHVLARNIFPRDAVGHFALDVAGLLRAAGADARLYAACMPREFAGIVRPVGLLARETRPGDLLFYNYSIEDEFLSLAAGLPCRKALYHHGVTPAEHFRPYDPPFAELLDRSRRQYPAFRAFDAALANSGSSLAELSGFLRPGVFRAVCPPMLAPTPLETAPADPAPAKDGPGGQSLLWVGRLAPHKRPDFALQLFRALGELAPGSTLTLVGGGKDAHPAFGARLDALLAALPERLARRVRLVSDIGPARLRALYAGASALLCTSRHEGFCMPLYEAMRLETPIFFTPQEGVEATLAGAGMPLPDDPGQAAEVLARALGEPELLASLRDRGRARGRELAEAARGAQIWQALDAALADPSRP